VFCVNNLLPIAIDASAPGFSNKAHGVKGWMACNGLAKEGAAE
jgi:hypothetical protein